MPHYFITGTDTNVGKTYVTCWLVRQWLAEGHSVGALKPIATGNRDDAIQIKAALASQDGLDEINPIHFREPASPLMAAMLEQRSIDFPALNQRILEVAGRFSHFAVEGVGGWRVPLAPGYTVRDWALDLALPVVVVARGSLGTLNHTILTVDSIRAAGLTCAGVIVNAWPEEGTSPDLDLARSRNVGLLRDLLGLPLLEFSRSVEAAGHVPGWLGGKEI